MRRRDVIAYRSSLGLSAAKINDVRRDIEEKTAIAKRSITAHYQDMQAEIEELERLAKAEEEYQLAEAAKLHLELRRRKRL